MELEDDNHDPNLSGSIHGRLSRPGAGPADDVLAAHRGHPYSGRRHLRLGRHLALRSGVRHDGAAGWWPALPAHAAHDPLPPEVSALVVRVEPRAAALLEPGHRLPGPAGRPLPLHR